LFVATPSDKGLWSFNELQITNNKNGKLNEFLLAFGEDNQKELYILTTEKSGPSGNTGKVYRIINA